MGDRQHKFNPTNIFLYQSKKQLKGSIKGDELRQELEGQRVLNVNVLDCLLAHPDLIPEEWKEKYIFFFGTIYRNSRGNLFVRYLRWNGSEWIWICLWLVSGFPANCFSAVAS
ncbi:hypothetical protein COY54_00555 [Candidatus Falkowbacteria bacterium CG_4_10_14_0_8_um_filter_41_36]|uniref:Uncharacterized protein n=2 Tax=Candidatus Falkowiibacteriota TaxID=1752728 RepID=A0A2G9ZMP8_9BACT|nr:MAG: hypothetical protein COX21_02735 [Candidatus Falkowbacteria bacterium CG23_combo_of_CG06-09_8_20_14_all_41_10]PIZ11355.1 MAG: hypothetical protein COY54_00555 [Candidatus Falkowbacteria bacterium CG_4_10_14_0_8_um_filter_41_36]